MQNSLKQLLGLTVAGLITGAVAFAAPIAPTGTHDQSIANYSFGGGNNGNVAQPNIPSQKVTINSSGPAGLTLALSAHARNVQPGAELPGSGGVFQAVAGNMAAFPTLRATWNFNFSIDNSDLQGGGLAAYTYVLTYGTDGSGLKSFNPLLIGDNSGGTGPVFNPASATHAGNSENLGFAFGLPFTNGELGPAIGFDPTENNVTYAFQLEAFNLNGNSVAKAAINVQVGNGGPGHTVPDAGSTLALLGVALAGVVGLRRKLSA